MLLKLRREQRMRIGPDVWVKVLAIHDGAVTLQIDAPPSFRISRCQPSTDAEKEVAATTAAQTR